jgi:phage tail-like protein
MPSNELLADDPLVSLNFFLEIDGETITYLSGVSGLDCEVEVTTTKQVGPKGQIMLVKALGAQVNAPDIQLTRMAPPDATKDKVWAWFNEIRDKGLALTHSSGRKNGSVVLYDTGNSEIARYNFYNAWPSKISTDSLSADSNEIVKETITLVCERLERKK